MANNLHDYQIKNAVLSLREENGAVVELKTECKVTNYNGVFVDHQALLDAMDLAGVPAYGHIPDGARFQHLRLVHRTPIVIDTKNFKVELGYENVVSGPNQNLYNPGLPGIIYGKTRCSVEQKKTNFYREQDVLGNWKPTKRQITVAHQYPSTDPNFAGQLRVQGGQVDVYQPHRNLHFQGYRATTAPWALANFLIAAINSNNWASGQPGNWMCTEVQWYIQRVGVYNFAFEFQHNEDGWDPTAVYIDEVTGRPPTGLVENVGWKTVPAHRRINFNLAFNAFFEGWSMLFGNLMG